MFSAESELFAQLAIVKSLDDCKHLSKKTHFFRQIHEEVDLEKKKMREKKSISLKGHKKNISDVFRWKKFHFDFLFSRFPLF